MHRAWTSWVFRPDDLHRIKVADWFQGFALENTGAETVIVVFAYPKEHLEQNFGESIWTHIIREGDMPRYRR